MSFNNAIDPSNMLAYLPKLNDIEQLLITPIYISMQMHYIKGTQYRYKGYVITFLRDVLSVAIALLRLPRECDLILIRPR